jgi:hypothetical protein
MQKVNYTAIAMGCEELRFSANWWADVNAKCSLALLATNVKVKSGKKIFEKIRTVEYKKGEKYAVVAVIENEGFDDISDDYEIQDPRTALNSAISQIPQDYIIVLIAHCDPTLTDSLIAENPRIDFGVQGHRKQTTAPVILSGKKQVLQFWTGGGQIAVLDKKGVVKWKAFVQTAMSSGKNNVITVDIFTMSGCPYSKNAIADFLPLMKDKNYAIKILFAGNYDPQSHNLSPGLADGDIQEEKIWLAMQDLYPERFQDFLFLALTQSSDSKEIAKTFGLDSIKFTKWDKKKGNEILKQSYKKSQSYNITQCPTIAVDNEIADINVRNIIKNLCKLTRDTVCFNFKETAKIMFIPSKYETPNLPVDYVFQSTRELVWELKTDTLNSADSSTKEILKNFNIERLPAIIFDKEVKNLYNFQVISQKLIEEQDGFVLEWGEIPDGEYYRRDFHENELVVICDSANTKEIKPFLKENVKYWHLLEDNEVDGWLIWWENKCLTSAVDESQAKTLVNYYKKIKGEL